MNLLHYFTAYPWLSAACLWIFAALIHTMPTPHPEERWYGWAFNFLHLLGANLGKIGEKNAF
jgi:hypothetical protein